MVDKEDRLLTYERLYRNMWAGQNLDVHSQDRFMLSGFVGSDGGSIANNPVLLALTEGQYLWGNLDNCGIRVLSIGTGDLPVVKNPSWNPSIPRPATQRLFGEHNIRRVFADLLKYALVNPATETEETSALMSRFGSLLAWYRRINPPLERAIELDDASPEAVRDLKHYSEKYCDSPEGSAILDEITEAIVLNSSRLHARLVASL
jgi:hypothetical protein